MVAHLRRGGRVSEGRVEESGGARVGLGMINRADACGDMDVETLDVTGWVKVRVRVRVRVTGWVKGLGLGLGLGSLVGLGFRIATTLAARVATRQRKGGGVKTRRSAQIKVGIMIGIVTMGIRVTGS